jgi:citrate/tricarballylate utilization protein
MGICNACRYCEGFCAVFPAMELRRTFSETDLKYLANLCHNCRGCYYACQYAPPHEFSVNVPQTLAELRMQTYGGFSWPAAMRGVFTANGWITSLVSALSVAIILILVLLTRNEALFVAHTGPESFYQVISYAAMVIPFSVVGLFAVYALWRSLWRSWKEIGGGSGDIRRGEMLLQAAWDVMRLKYLDGGGHGCNYPDDRFSMVRRYFHHAAFYGFKVCFLSTVVAFGYDHLLGLPAPYPFWSWPVFLGTIGGLSLLAGTGGLLYLKFHMDRKPAFPGSVGMDTAFAVNLFLISLTGLLLLALRSTAAMGFLLVVHLGLVLGLFITLPYGKFVHGIYRYLALVRNAGEQKRGKA